jgi:Phage protein (N4 Gp49/phage Sf6 gene 66) family
MTTDEASIEEEIVRKGKTAPRLTPQHIDDQIAGEYWGRASNLFKGCPGTGPMECLTICVLTLKNGYTIVGKSACASPENYDADLGYKIAREDARKQIWALEGYLLKSRLTA